MTLRTYEPWNVLNQFQSEINRLFDGQSTRYRSDDNAVATDWTPAVDIREEADQFVLTADLPGVDPKDIEVSMENGELTIRGERQSSATDEAKGFHRVERVTGQFYRRFTLPDTANSEDISARSHHGVLEISIPRQAEKKARKITVEH